MSYNPYSNEPFSNELLVEYADFPLEYSAEFRTRLIQMINDMCISINAKESGFYSDEITITGSKVLPTYSNQLQGNRSVYTRSVRRKCIFTEALPNSSAKSVAHNIEFPKTSVGWRLWGCASQIDGNEDLQGFLQMPYAHPTPANCIALYCNRNNVIITTGSDRTNFNFSFVVIEYAIAPDTEDR